jgi:hypothetical protein
MNQKKELTWSSVKSEPEGRREQERGGIRRRQTDRRDIRKETFLADDFLYLRSPRPPTLVQFMKDQSFPLKVKSI